MSEKTLDISWGAITKVFIAIFIFYLIYLARSVVLWFIFAVTIAVLLEPAIEALRKIYIPKIIAVLIVYFSIFGILGLLIYFSAPIFISEMQQFLQQLPGYFEQISPILKQFGFDIAQNFKDFSDEIIAALQQSSKGIIKAIMIFFGGVASAISILTMAFFISLENRAVEKFLILLFPQKYEDQIENIFGRVQKKVSGWFAARVLACLFVGVASYIIFFIFGVKYAFILAIISGFLNFIPYIGPWITSLLLILFIGVSSGSWTLVLYVLISVLVVQEIENKLLTPVLMKKMTDIPPVLVLVSLFVGAELFGFLGMIFAVPVFGIIYEFIKEFLEKRRAGTAETYE
jgi:predicted PurR-regulated permease PerM